ncbi:MAG: hypothetical protein HC922_05135 [Leptolyngbyaceae cyanobacterium SM2_3_12]|nr:hypothetical protein [Leptolyngbyaceae cyanobacterium SM2_3_12]
MLVGLAAAAAVTSVLPAQADQSEIQAETGIQIETSELTDPANFVETDLENSALEPAPVVEVPVAEVEETTAADLLNQPTAIQGNEGFLAFESAGIDSALNNASVEATPSMTEGIDLAQVTRGTYGGVAPAYLGVGGNLGIGDPDSALGDFGFAVISKISLGPRFSLRPNFFISERFTNFTIPLTYNFNTLSMGGFRFQPYVGAGADIPFNGNVALLLNAGADVPISRDFTVNTAANFRVTSGFGLGLTVGLGYNFPFIFQ